MHDNVAHDASVDLKDLTTPTGSIKEPDTSAPWTEVVRRGRNRSKTVSVHDKIHQNDRCCLEY
jgi:hypothetical protein